MKLFKFKFSISCLLVCGAIINNPTSIYSEESYVEPGSLRISNKLTLEGVFHKVRSDWGVRSSKSDKIYTKEGSGGHGLEAEWGQNLLTELSTRLTPEISARALFETQGEYADRYWRPVNIEHEEKLKSNPVFLRQYQARIDKPTWFVHGFSGVGHGSWKDKGDFFGLYRESFGESDYLGSSSFFGLYPDSWRQDLFLNVAKHRVPNGVEAGFNNYGIDAGAAGGDELAWGFDHSYFGRFSVPIKTSKLSFVYMNDDVPASFFSDSERKKAGSVHWQIPFEAGHLIDVGVLYQPFRVGKSYKVAREADGGAGLLGSSWNISDKTAQKEDAFAERIRMEGVAQLGSRFWVGTLDLTHAGILAGNKEQIEVGLGTDLHPLVKWQSAYTYRRPIEGPIPFLYEGTPDNIGAVASSPRGPESPFTVGWENRKATIVLTTLWFDPTPGTSPFNFEPTSLASWNLNKDEDAPYSFGVQHRMSDYPTALDRQYYYDSNGNITWESAAQPGAWPTDHPIHEFRFLCHGVRPGYNWTLGIAGGQNLAVSGVAYTNSTAKAKAISDYYSIEGRLDLARWNIWAHYGTGVWGPEPHLHPFFGNSYDRLYGVGTRFYFTSLTSWDISYLAAHQTDNLFVSTGLGSFDEIRTLFSHRFGFLLNFNRPLKSGTVVP